MSEKNFYVDVNLNGNKAITDAVPTDPKHLTNKAYVDNVVGTGGTYTHEQNLPEPTWVVEHNLGFNPNVRIENSAGDFMQAKITTVDNNILLIEFDNGNAGKAYCS